MTHLTLEQCTKLKELGFPQDTKFQYDEGASHPRTEREHEEWGFGDTKLCACPTLEELIGWLVGDLRNTFMLVMDEEWGKYDDKPEPAAKWHARYYPNTPVGFYDVGGPSPLEATYNLAVAVKERK